MCFKYLHFFAVTVCFLASSFALVGCSKEKPAITADALHTGSVDVNTGTLVRLAEASASSGDYASASAALKRAIKLEPRSAKLYLALAKSLLHLERFDEALDAVTRAQHLEPENPEVALIAGQVYFARGQTEHARQSFEKAAALDPRNSLAINAVGVALDSQGLHDQAQSFYRRALNITPDLTAARNNLGLSLALAGHPKDAISTLAPIAKDSETSPQIWQNLALAHAMNGDRKKAEKIYGRFLGEEDIAANLKTLLPHQDMEPLPWESLQ